MLSGVPASSPVALMRSRYAAYAVGAVGHIIKTTHPDSPHSNSDTQAWEAELRQFSEAMDFVGLEIHDHAEDGDIGHVHFSAHLMQAETDQSFSERSRFERQDNRWLYVSGAS